MTKIVSLFRYRYNKRRDSLRIEPLQRNDSGVYSCMTTRDQCHKWSNVTLNVTGIFLSFIALSFLKRVCCCYCSKRRQRIIFN